MSQPNCQNIGRFIITSGLFIQIIKTIIDTIIENIIKPLMNDKIKKFRNTLNDNTKINIGNIIIDLLYMASLVLSLFFIIRYIT